MKDVECTTLHRIVLRIEYLLVSQSFQMIASAFLGPLHSPRITRILQLISLYKFDKEIHGRTSTPFRGLEAKMRRKWMIEDSLKVTQD